MLLRRRYFIFVIALIIMGLTGCNVTRHLESNEYLLIKNKIQVKGHTVPIEDLAPYLQQQPNGKFLGVFRSNIEFYYLGSKGKETKFKKWLRTKVGKPPVILDTSLVSTAAKQMGLYLNNLGYFHSLVTDSVVYKKKKATVVYRIETAKPYRIRNITYSIADTQIARFLYRDTARTLIKTGNNYDTYVFDEERTRITSNLRNFGFFRFAPNFIKYTIDTNLRSHQLDLTLEVVNSVVPQPGAFSTFRIIPHRRFFVNKIYIYPEYDHVNPFRGNYDTIVLRYRISSKNEQENEYIFLNHNDFEVKPRTIAQAIMVAPGTHYNLQSVNQTYSQLAGLQVFKYINLQFREVPGAISRPLAYRDLIDCHIELSKKDIQGFSVTTDGTNSSGALGVQANVGYQHYNLFKGAQLFRINLSGSLQMQATDGFSDSKFFNTIEFGVNSSLTFPQFLIPFRQQRLYNHFRPKTIISLGYNYQLQQHFNRHISNITFGYSWQQNVEIQHLLNPIEFSLVKIFKDSYFDSVLNTQKDNRLKNQYTDHLIAGLKYTFTYNSQKLNKSKDFIYIRSNLETGGNVLYLANLVLYGPADQANPYKLLGLPFAQYVRPDFDFRYYDVMRDKFSLVYRFYGGIGIPYGNVNVLPFEKTFFAGGANGMRGWRMYALGPGSYENLDEGSSFNQIGDIQLEANLEYRFPLYDWIRGAFYLDAGNIWLLRESPDLPGGKFIFSEFLGQVAIDVGVGLRFDFDFFIFRFDPAIAIKKPTYPKGDRWTVDKLQLKDVVWNFGIGYPF